MSEPRMHIGKAFEKAGAELDGTPEFTMTNVINRAATHAGVPRERVREYVDNQKSLIRDGAI